MIHILLFYLSRSHVRGTSPKILMVCIYIQYDTKMLIGVISEPEELPVAGKIYNPTLPKCCIKTRIFVLTIDKYNLINKINRYNNLPLVN